MSGISRIQTKRETRYQGGQEDTRMPGRELFFKDGDQAFMYPVATGDEGDVNLDEIYLYTYREGNRWMNLLDDPSVDTSMVPADSRATHKFSFWAYVYEVVHTESRNDEWEPVSGPGGRKMFKETINDFRVVTLTFGRSDYIWNQLVDIYNDWNGLDNGVIRIKRTGAGMQDTSYALAATTRNDTIPEEVDSSDLPAIKEYFKGRYGGYTNNNSNNAIINNGLADAVALVASKLF